VQWSQISVRLPDVTLSCLDSRTQGPCVVLVHGLAGHAAEWDRTAEVLAARCRVIAFDQRGHGQSSCRPADLSREAFVRDVVAVIDRLGSGEPVSLVGKSMGAHTAMLTAAAYPQLVDRLVMVEGGVGGGGTAVVRRLSTGYAPGQSPFLIERQRQPGSSREG
jgi:pimeloyl-ACP methyl ester carboxylesterase